MQDFSYQRAIEKDKIVLNFYFIPDKLDLFILVQKITKVVEEPEFFSVSFNETAQFSSCGRFKYRNYRI